MVQDSSTATGREILPDLVRASALFGIAIVNAQIFAMPLSVGLFGEAMQGEANFAAHFGMIWLAAGKFYALFSMMFGASLFYQVKASQRAGADLNRRQTRRLIGLGVLGLLHALFLFLGDILVTYAILGALLLTLLGASEKTLLRAGVGLILLQAVILLALGGMFVGIDLLKPGLLAGKMAETGAAATAALGEGSFLDGVLYRAISFPETLSGVLMSQGVSTFGYFCIGLAFARSGWIADPSAKIWSQARWIALPIGLIAGAAGAWGYVMGSGPADGYVMLSMALVTLAALGQSIGYAGWLAVLARRPVLPVRFFARAGQASLSAYLLQSVIMAIVFSAWGLGYFGALDAAAIIGVGFATALASVLSMSVWMSFFRRGPVETLLRAWTYG